MKNPFTTTPTASRRVRHHSAGMASFLALSRGIESTITPAKELAALRALQTRWEEFNEQIKKVSSETAHLEIKARKAAYAAVPTAENFEKMRAGELDKGALMEQNAHALRSAKDARFQANAECPAIFIRMIGRALAVLDGEIEKLRTAEAQTAEKYGAPFAPSPTVLALENLAYHLEDRGKRSSSCFSAAIALENLAYHLEDRAAVAAVTGAHSPPRVLVEDILAI